MKYRTMPDGSIVFPHRGTPPDELPGYVRDPGDPYRQTLPWVPCTQREELHITLKCKKKIRQFICLAGRDCSQAKCAVCPIRTPPP